MVCEELIVGLQAIRALSNGPITINSGFRCINHNASVKGKPASFHCVGMAADLVPRFMKPEELKALAIQVPQFISGGIGIYKWGIHVDVRPIAERWVGVDTNLHDDSFEA